MGSCGWRQCYWCDYWVWNPYLLEFMGCNALCNMCWDWQHDEDGGPYEPRRAVTRRARKIRTDLCRALGGEEQDGAIYYHIAEHLVEWWEP